jgi:hypothetical protein
MDISWNYFLFMADLVVLEALKVLVDLAAQI